MTMRRRIVDYYDHIIVSGIVDPTILLQSIRTVIRMLLLLYDLSHASSMPRRTRRLHDHTYGFLLVE